MFAVNMMPDWLVTIAQMKFVGDHKFVCERTIIV
jgi:hypothetical protein